MKQAKYTTLRVSSAFAGELRTIRDALAGELGARLSIEDAMLHIIAHARRMSEGVQELGRMMREAGTDYADVANAMLTVVAMDVAAKHEAVRRLEAGDDEPYNVDHVAHWNGLTAEEKASHLAVARVRVEATTGVNPLAPMRSVPEAEAWMAEHPPAGMALDNAQANERMNAKAARMAHRTPQVVAAAAKRARRT